MSLVKVEGPAQADRAFLPNKPGPIPHSLPPGITKVYLGTTWEPPRHRLTVSSSKRYPRQLQLLYPPL